MDHSENLSLTLNVRCPFYERSANCTLWTKSDQLPVFANKVLLEPSHVPSLPGAAFVSQQCGEVVATETRLRSTKPKNTYHVAFYRKSLLTALWHSQTHFYFSWSYLERHKLQEARKKRTNSQYMSFLFLTRVGYNTILVTLHEQALSHIGLCHGAAGYKHQLHHLAAAWI